MDLERWNEIDEEARAVAKECNYDSAYTEDYVKDQHDQAEADAEEWAGWTCVDE